MNCRELEGGRVLLPGINLERLRKPLKLHSRWPVICLRFG